MTNPPGRVEEVKNESFLGALYLIMVVAYADEEFTEDERKMLTKQVHTLSSDLDDVRGFKSFIDSLPARVESTDWVERALDTVREKLTDEQDRMDAFAMALEMAKADGKICFRETQALLEIADQLGISPEFARARLKRVRMTPLDRLPDLDKTPWQRGPAAPKS